MLQTAISCHACACFCIAFKTCVLFATICHCDPPARCKIHLSSKSSIGKMSSTEKETELPELPRPTLLGFLELMSEMTDEVLEELTWVSYRSQCPVLCWNYNGSFSISFNTLTLQCAASLTTDVFVYCLCRFDACSMPSFVCVLVYRWFSGNLWLGRAWCKYVFFMIILH